MRHFMTVKVRKRASEISILDRQKKTAKLDVIFHETFKNHQREYFNNLDTKKVTNNRAFWRTVVSIFSNKNSKSDTTTLKEDHKTALDEKELCRSFSTYFANIVSDRKVPNIHKDVSDIRCNHDLMLAAINTFQNHLSVLKSTKWSLQNY